MSSLLFKKARIFDGASDIAVARIEAHSDAYRKAHAVRMLGDALVCGLTTVRDIGGGNCSLYKAAADGLIRAPHFLYAGKILSMTGGHGDMRQIEQAPRYAPACACVEANTFSVMADGDDGTDLLGSTYTQKCRELELRSAVFTPLELLRQATGVAAEMMLMDGEIGCVKVGVRADLIGVDGDRLKHIGLVTTNGRHLSTIVRRSEVKRSAA